MRIIWLVMSIFLAPFAAAAGVAQQADITVTAIPARIEIERILTSDNVDTESLGTRGVATAIAGIVRGQAPLDFWLVYGMHVAAWEQLADAEDRLSAAQDAPARDHWMAQADRANRAIEATFTEVERIARRYGAKMPVPVSDIKSMV